MLPLLQPSLEATSIHDTRLGQILDALFAANLNQVFSALALKTLRKHMTVPIPANKSARLEALRQYRLLDRAPERASHDLTALASFICGIPLALLTPEGFASGVLGTLDP
jgi:hypothetical protein